MYRVCGSVSRLGPQGDSRVAALSSVGEWRMLCTHVDRRARGPGPTPLRAARNPRIRSERTRGGATRAGHDPRPRDF